MVKFYYSSARISLKSITEVNFWDEWLNFGVQLISVVCFAWSSVEVKLQENYV